MRRWRRLSYHNSGLHKILSLSYHVRHSNCNSTFRAFLQANLYINLSKFCFRNSSLSILISDEWFKRCWCLWNVNIAIAFNYSYTDLITRLWRFFGFVSFTALILSNDGFLVVTFNVRNQACLKPICQQTWHLFLNLLVPFYLLCSEFPFSRSTFVFPLHLAWIYDIRNLRYEAHCFLTTLKGDNLRYEKKLIDLFKFKLFRDSEWEVSPPTISGPLVCCIERWTTNHSASAGYNCIECQLSFWGPLDCRGPETS